MAPSLPCVSEAQVHPSPVVSSASAEAIQEDVVACLMEACIIDPVV